MAQTNQPRRRTRRFAKVYHQQIDALRSGDFTPAMLIVMNILTRWADQEGEVKYCSAKYLVTMTSNAYSERTFSEALHRLERMGYITRHMTFGSHQSYPITIHNWEASEFVDGATITTTINQKETRTWREIKNGACDEGSDETSDEGSDETSDETSDEGSDKDRIVSKIVTQTDIQTDIQTVTQTEGETEVGLTALPLPNPINTDTPIWESWNESLEGQSPEQVQRILLYHARFNRRPYWKDKLTPRNIRSRFKEMVNDFPCGWRPPEHEPETVTDPNDENFEEHPEPLKDLVIEELE